MVINSYSEFSDSLLFWWSKLSRLSSIYFENIIYCLSYCYLLTSLRQRNKLSSIEYILWFHWICFITSPDLLSKGYERSIICRSSLSQWEQYLIRALHSLFVTKRYTYISLSPMFGWYGLCKFSFFYIISLLYTIIISCGSITSS